MILNTYNISSTIDNTKFSIIEYGETPIRMPRIWNIVEVEFFKINIYIYQSGKF